MSEIEDDMKVTLNKKDRHIKIEWIGDKDSKKKYTALEFYTFYCKEIARLHREDEQQLKQIEKGGE